LDVVDSRQRSASATAPTGRPGAERGRNPSGRADKAKRLVHHFVLVLAGSCGRKQTLANFRYRPGAVGGAALNPAPLRIDIIRQRRIVSACSASSRHELSRSWYSST
jgi:hypothetical protein